MAVLLCSGPRRATPRGAEGADETLGTACRPLALLSPSGEPARRSLVEQPAGGPGAVHRPAGSSSGSAPRTACATASALPSPETTSQTSSALLIAGEPETDPGRRRLRAVADGEHRALVTGGRRAREDRRHVALGTDPEQQHVETWARSPGAAAAASSAGVPGGGVLRLGEVARRTAASRGCGARAPRPGPAAPAGPASRCARRCRRARSARRPTRRRRRSQSTALAHRLLGQRGDLLEDGDPDPAPGQHHRRRAVHGLRRGQPGDQRLAPRRGPAGRRRARRRRRAPASLLDAPPRGRVRRRLFGCRVGAPLALRSAAPAARSAGPCRCRRLGRVEPDVLARRRPLGQAGDAGRRLERVAVGLVGVQPAQLLAEQVAERPLGQRHRGVGPEGLG